MSDFYLDAFEVTVGRFRAFVKAYPESLPRPGDGAHPRIPNSGWKVADDEALLGGLGSMFNVGPNATPRDASAWDDGDSFAAGIENLPANRESWLMAFAFCAWDGGRLPTEAEWDYAAVGGSEQRPYPWGEETPQAWPGNCAAKGNPNCIEPAGARAGSAGRWGHFDLGGNLNEWTLDLFWKDLPLPCADCAQLTPNQLPINGRGPAGPAPVYTGHVVRGGAFDCTGVEDKCNNAAREHASAYSIATGFRCARDRVR